MQERTRKEIVIGMISALVEALVFWIRVIWARYSKSLNYRLSYIDSTSQRLVYDPKIEMMQDVYVESVLRSGSLAIQSLVANIAASLNKNSRTHTHIGPEEHAERARESFENMGYTEGQIKEALADGCYRGYTLAYDKILNLLSLLHEVLTDPRFHWSLAPTGVWACLRNLESHEYVLVAQSASDVLEITKQ